MKSILAVSLLLALAGTAGCDRRRAQPIEGSDTPETSASQSAVRGESTVAPTDQQTVGSPQPDPCAGMTGDAQRDCQTQHIQERRDSVEAHETQDPQDRP